MPGCYACDICGEMSLCRCNGSASHRQGNRQGRGRDTAPVKGSFYLEVRGSEVDFRTIRYDGGLVIIGEYFSP